MNISQDRSTQLSGRMQDFAVDVISITRRAVSNTENKIIVSQLIRSATSIGANYAEANNAASKLDFRNKIFISKKEAAEAKYWLQLLSRLNSGLDCTVLIDECTQLLLILQKIISTMKNGK